MGLGPGIAAAEVVCPPDKFISANDLGTELPGTEAQKNNWRNSYNLNGNLTGTYPVGLSSDGSQVVNSYGDRETLAAFKSAVEKVTGTNEVPNVLDNTVKAPLTEAQKTEQANRVILTGVGVATGEVMLGIAGISALVIANVVRHKKEVHGRIWQPVKSVLPAKTASQINHSRSSREERDSEQALSQSQVIKFFKSEYGADIRYEFGGTQPHNETVNFMTALYRGETDPEKKYELQRNILFYCVNENIEIPRELK